MRHQGLGAGQAFFPAGSAGKESACKAGDPGSILGSGSSPGEGAGYPLEDSCQEEPRGQGSLVGCSPCGRKELDTTEHKAWARHCQLLGWNMRGGLRN